MILTLISLFTSALTCFLIIHLNFLHKITSDPVGKGPQKFHKKPVPRIGGLGIALGLFASWLFLKLKGDSFSKEFFLFLISAIPAFSGGILEDLTKSGRIKIRLFLTLLSAGMGAFLLDSLITRIDVPFIDFFLKLFPISFAFTVFAVSGICHAINIIDGFNGLSGMVSLIILTSLGYVSYLTGDSFLLSLCLSAGGAIIGFLVWNYPYGLIFLGDGGAYLLGFLIAEISVLLVNKHPEVSAWFPMMLCVYPVTETLFSIYRKKFLRKMSPALPDGLHFHMLIYKRIVKQGIKEELKQNFMTSPYLWTITLISNLFAVFFWKRTSFLVYSVISFILFYVWLYGRIVHFKTPKLLKYLQKTKVP